MPQPIQQNAAGIDLSGRFYNSTAISASPSANAETIVAQLSITDSLVIAQGIWLAGCVAWTVGTSGTASTIRLRQTNVSGTVIASTGAVTTAAASLRYHNLFAIDTAAVLPNQTYVLTLQVTNGAAASTVSYVFLGAIIV